MNQTVVFTSAGNVELQNKDCPKPGKGEVLIETEVSLVSTGTELTFLSGECPENSKWSTYIHYPMTSGGSFKRLDRKKSSQFQQACPVRDC